MKINYIIILLLALCGWRCTTDRTEFPSPFDGEGTRLRFEIQNNSGETVEANMKVRASGITPTDEELLDNVWIFQFDGTDSTSLLKAPPRYITGHANLIAPQLFADGGSVEQRFVFLGNLGDPAYNWGVTVGQSTYANVVSKMMVIQDETELYKSNRILMAGEAKAYTSVPSLNVTLRHCVARMELTLACTNAQIIIESVELGNVPRNVLLFGGISTAVWPAIYPAAGNSDFITSYTRFTGADLPASNGTPKTMFWYMPVNQQGSVTNADPRHKNLLAPRNATFIKVKAKFTGNTPNTPLEYTFYPGLNATNDFNIKVNGNYKYSVTITGKDDALIDSRIDDQTVINYASQPANCYIANPSTGTATKLLRVYPTQVDLVWGIRNENVPANMIGETTPWTVDVLWMDEQNLVSTNSASGYTYLSKNTGTGISDYFEVAVPPTTKLGNFVVYLYKTGDASKTALWSWHFWVTNYNPDSRKASPTVPEQYIYPVEGGEVHRYRQERTNQYHTDDNNYYWQNAASANRYSMDREIGQMSNYPEDVTVDSKGYLYYQYGRKDPFPVPGRTLYNLSGTTAITGQATGSIGIVYGINNPGKFLTSMSSNWTGSNARNLPIELDPILSTSTSGKRGYSIWYDKEAFITSYTNHTNYGEGDLQGIQNTQKSLFDPCPPGWMVPTDIAFYSAMVSYLQAGAVTPSRPGLEWTKDGKSGMRYWPYLLVDGNYPVNGRIFFPAAGQIVYNQWLVQGVSTVVSLWTATNVTYVNKTTTGEWATVNPSSSGYGLPVRCVRQQ